MLRELTIENLAVIEKAQAHFGGSFNVFTGETGAGKSVLIGGINAILGQRTTKDIVRTGTQRASVTALFDDIPKSFVHCVEGGESVLYLSQLSTATLLRRSGLEFGVQR